MYILYYIIYIYIYIYILIYILILTYINISIYTGYIYINSRHTVTMTIGKNQMTRGHMQQR